MSREILAGGGWFETQEEPEGCSGLQDPELQLPNRPGGDSEMLLHSHVLWPTPSPRWPWGLGARLAVSVDVQNMWKSFQSNSQ